MRFTVGMSNILDTKAPRLTELVGNGVTNLGKGAFTSQYDLRGRRAFVNLNFRY